MTSGCCAEVPINVTFLSGQFLYDLEEGMHVRSFDDRCG